MIMICIFFRLTRQMICVSITISPYVAEHNDGMKVFNLYIAQIKQKQGIIERENYNKPKSEKGGQPECPKEIAIEEALKYFQMIPSES